MSTPAYAVGKVRTTHTLFTESTDPDVRRAEIVHHLTMAMQLEHATIPPYIVALYSIRDGFNAEPVRILRAVVIEEMLHMVLVANLLNAIQEDAHIELDRDGFIPDYPGTLPMIDNGPEVHLGRFSPETIDIFIQIEKPAQDPDDGADGYASVGQFYAAIKDAVDAFCRDFGPETLFIGKPSRQIGPEHYYNGGGEILRISDYQSARKAIAVIVNQGEGFNESIFSGDHETFGEVQDPAHYYKFKQIRDGRYYANTDRIGEPPSGEILKAVYDSEAVWPARFDGDPENLPKEIQKRLISFEHTYWGLLRDCEAAFNGAPEHLEYAVARMYEVKYAAQSLMRMPIDDTGETAGPRFRYRPRHPTNSDPKSS